MPLYVSLAEGRLITIEPPGIEPQIVPKLPDEAAIKILDQVTPLDNDILPEALGGLDATQQIVQCLHSGWCICLNVAETVVLFKPLADLSLASSGTARQQKVRHGVREYAETPGRQTENPSELGHGPAQRFSEKLR